jgi:hypothetical protein
MEIKQSTIEEIVETEKQLILNADARYGKYSHHAKECSVFLSRSIVAVDHSHHDTFGRLCPLRDGQRIPANALGRPQRCICGLGDHLPCVENRTPLI